MVAEAETSSPGPPGLWARRTAALAYVGSAWAAARWRGKLRSPAYVTTPWLLSAPVVLARAVPPSWKRDASVWSTQMWAYKTAFELPHDDAERQRRRTRLDTFLKIDRVLGLGKVPSYRLQKRLRGKQVSTLDKAVTLFYWTWYAEPHAVLALIRARRPDLFPSAAARLALALNATLVGYWAIPAAPPWYASEEKKRMQGDVGRVMDEVVLVFKGKRNPKDQDHMVSANPFAAMPSDHFGSALMAALLASEIDGKLGAATWAYALALGFCLVYLGEHYVIDLIAGGAVALGVNAARGPVGRLGAAVLGDAQEI